MKNHLLKVTSFLITACLVFSCNTKKIATNDMENSMPDTTQTRSMDTHDMSMDNSMMKSMDDMKNMKISGDVDTDFASMMILHHQSAIDMSEAEIANGKDADAKEMAQKMMTMQKAEIASLQKFTESKETFDTKMDHNNSDGLSKAMENMMDKMNAMQMTGDVDKDFVMMMVPHHEGALDMAKHEVEHGKNNELKKMAQKMITDQQVEITALKKWQASN